MHGEIGRSGSGKILLGGRKNFLRFAGPIEERCRILSYALMHAVWIDSSERSGFVSPAIITPSAQKKLRGT